MVDLAAAGKIKPITPIKVFEGSKVEDAFRYMQKGAHIGKIVVTIPEDRTILRVALSTKSLRLSADASYLIVGGLGGLGRAVSTWMVENGARSLIYLSRSAGKSESDQAFFKELKSQGCTATTFAGSVSIHSDVEKCVELAPKPIKGVLQMSMVLRDGPFLSMCHSDWNEVLSPKVQGTWNLHNVLPKDLDFFVATSSISGTFGNHGQANYAAANTFLDSFIQWRKIQNLAGSVLDVGVMADIGYVSQNAGIQGALCAAGTYLLHEQEFLDAMHWAILKSDPRTEKPILGNSQVAIGVRATKPLSEPSCRVNWKRDIRMSANHNAKGVSSDGADSSTDALKEFIGSLDSNPEILNTPQAVDLITHEIGVKIYAFMMRPVEELDTSLTLSALGVDSLVTIEIRNWMKRSLGAELSTLEVLGAGTIDVLGAAVVKALKVKSLKKEVEKDEKEGEKVMHAIPLSLHHPMKPT
jgi:NAD(P)-dependent dehydrogenase (short-subunit alcohol dehydrogenase family)